MEYVSSETIQHSHEDKKPLDLLLTWVPYNISLPLIKNAITPKTSQLYT